MIWYARALPNMVVTLTYIAHAQTQDAASQIGK